MPTFVEVFNALYDLLEADDVFKGHVSKHDFGKIAETADITAVLRVGGFTNAEDAYGGVYATTWTIFIDLYCPYVTHAEEEVAELVAARDTIVDLIQKNIYLGKGEGNVEGIQSAIITGGTGLEYVLLEEGVCTHLNLSVQTSIYQTRTVVME